MLLCARGAQLFHSIASVEKYSTAREQARLMDAEVVSELAASCIFDVAEYIVVHMERLDMRTSS